MIHYQKIDSPIGPLMLVGCDAALMRIEILAASQLIIPDTWQPASCSVLEQAKTELGEYFQGSRQVFTTPLAGAGTMFQQQVWQALVEIGYGQTCSYSAIAQKIGRPRAVRAVGAAIGANPLPVIVPCHRVLGKNGTLTGFLGGLDAKAWLLNREQPSAP